jgi:MFS family permease
MLFRFSLYGFLKNQQYYEPFIILAFLEKGLSFFTIGLLIGFRELAVTLIEIPSGAIADLYGRRRAMIFSFVAYIGSFATFSYVENLAGLFAAMGLFALGEAFRTGTHKAIIFDWLARENRLDERTRIYGYTRSWSKVGSAVSALLAAAFVFFSGSYSSVFLFCIVPYLLNIINFLGYPKFLDGETGPPKPLSAAHRLAFQAVRLSVSGTRLRGLFLESMLLEGVYKVAKDYLQPVLKGLAVALPVLVIHPTLFSDWDETQRAAILIGAVFGIHFLIMGLASRQAHRVQQRLGGEDALARFLWKINLIVYTGMTASLALGRPFAAVFFFIAAGAVQNLFRPAQISRFDACSPPKMGATVLSVESQAKALAAAIMSPAVGWGVDHLSALHYGAGTAFWPAAAAGVVASLLVIVIGIGACGKSAARRPQPRSER